MTRLLGTHDRQLARRIGHRVVFLDGGRVVESGTAEKLFRDPEYPRPREFLQKVRDVDQGT